jgi:5-methylcytosine-specific restriction endonuclease McrA
LGYRFDSLENKVRTITEFLHNHDNLRTLCKECHKRVTKQYLCGNVIVNLTNYKSYNNLEVILTKKF